VYRQFVRDSTRWDGFAFRPDDIVISTPTKCGTTWTQMITALLVLQTPTLDEDLATLSPWVDMLTRPLDEVLADLERQTHRRFMKTHTPLDGLPYDERVTYICVGRDPRDVALSWDNHQSNQNREALEQARDRVVDPGGAPRAGQAPRDRPPTPRERFWRWVDDPTPPTASASTLLLTLHHLETFWAVRDAPNVVLLHYGDLRADLDGQMRALSDRLDIPVDEAIWPSLVAAAGLDAMREHASRLAPDAATGFWHDDRRFFHRGTMGEWRELLDDADLIRYRQRIAEIASPGLAAWVHQPGWG
jgi:hypothetical protein